MNQYLDKLLEARSLQDKAELDWVNGSYSEAIQLITQAYDILDSIPTSVPFVLRNWWILVVILVIAALITILGIAALHKKRYA